MLDKLKYFVETKAFEMFSFLGERMGIESRRIRTFFIYTSFVTVGSPIIVLIMIAGFWKYLFQLVIGARGKKKIWDS
jgi:phage shock protein C